MRKEELNERLNVEDLEGTVELAIPEGLTKDLKKEIKSIENVGKQEIRFLVDSFYQIQHRRIMLQSQINSIRRSTDDTINSYAVILDWQLKAQMVQEKGIKDALEIICRNNEVGRWLLKIKGIGPTLAAGLLAYFDVTGIEYATHFMSYAGLNDNNRPWLGAEKAKKIVNEVLGHSKEITDEHLEELSIRTKWKYGYLNKSCTKIDKKGNVKRSKQDLINAIAKIPYNKNLKILMYKVAQQFVKISYNPDSLYGRLYKERKILEMQLNEQGHYADQAKKILETKNIGKDTDAYKAYSQGKLPKAHIQRRAERWATKIFISHLFEEMYRVANDKAPESYYILVYGEEGSHRDYIEPEIPFTK